MSPLCSCGSWWKELGFLSLSIPTLAPSQFSWGSFELLNRGLVLLLEHFRFIPALSCLLLKLYRQLSPKIASSVILKTAQQKGTTLGLACYVYFVYYTGCIRYSSGGFAA